MLNVNSSPATITLNSREDLNQNTLPYAQEQAWFYYLSEIALRQIGNRVLNSFYQENFESWKEYDIPSTINIANEFFRQLNEWYECLPAPMHFDDSTPGVFPNEELPYLLDIRLQEIRSWILRPFLFLAIHSPPRTVHRSLLDAFVEKSFICHTRLIEGNSIVHRHHGTWYMLRLSVTSALCLIAAERRDFEVPALQQSVRLAIDTLKYWEAGSPG
ncbi:hypothetical protein N7456_003286 [Penicillium angulare]|uniref:Uncharacterized protein n=1 Tax=Penicillium angulare TaxID=116970 RepID=A0A9W9FUC5_9EURO|nr:hypothetical protein N7456_003286 [Penicillium angulare]